MKAISMKLRKEIDSDSFYRQCCITGRSDEKIDIHHNLIFAGSQVNEKFCLLPLTKSVHDNIVKYKQKCDWIMLNRATDEQLKQYSKSTNYIVMRNKLNAIYGKYTPPVPVFKDLSIKY